MSRLPEIGGDSNTWGVILNDYLSVSLNADGTIKSTSAALLSGNQTIAGVKTFSSAPLIPDASFAIAKIIGLQAALDGKASTTAATTTAAGIVELATTAEAEAGSSTSLAVTPAGVAAYVDANSGGSTYTVLTGDEPVPGGTPAGLIIRLAA